MTSLDGNDIKNYGSMKKIGVLLSGCGFLDGTEIQGAVLTLLALEKAGAEAVCFALNTGFAR